MFDPLSAADSCGTDDLFGQKIFCVYVVHA
jgi:hypothetical protein